MKKTLIAIVLLLILTLPLIPMGLRIYRKLDGERRELRQTLRQVSELRNEVRGYKEQFDELKRTVERFRQMPKQLPIGEKFRLRKDNEDGD